MTSFALLLLSVIDHFKNSKSFNSSAWQKKNRENFISLCKSLIKMNRSETVAVIIVSYRSRLSTWAKNRRLNVQFTIKCMPYTLDRGNSHFQFQWPTTAKRPREIVTDNRHLLILKGKYLIQPLSRQQKTFVLTRHNYRHWFSPLAVSFSCIFGSEPQTIAIINGVVIHKKKV